MSLLQSVLDVVLRRKAGQTAVEGAEEERPLGPDQELLDWEITVPVTRMRTVVTGIDAFLRESTEAKTCYSIGQVQPDTPEDMESLYLLFDGHPGIEVLWCGIPKIWPYRLVPPAKATHFLVKLQAGAVLDLFRVLLQMWPTIDYVVFDQGGSSNYGLEAEAVAIVKQAKGFSWSKVVSKPDHFRYRFQTCSYQFEDCGLDAEGDRDVKDSTGEEWLSYGPQAPEALKRLVAR